MGADPLSRVTIGYGLLLAIVMALGWQIVSYRSWNDGLTESLLAQRELYSRILASQTETDGGTLATLHPDVAWAASTSASAEQALQTWSLNALRENSLAIRQYHPMQLEPLGDTPTLSIRLEFSGPLAGLVQFLAQAESHRPALAIQNLQIRPLAQRDQINNATMVSAQVTLWGVLADDDV